MKSGAVGISFPHESAIGHVQGAAPYIDDMPQLPGELIVDFVGSTFAHCEILRVDTSGVTKIPGAFAYTCKDIEGINLFGPIIKDEVFLAEKHAHFLGEPIVVVAAPTRELLQQAKRAVKLELKELPAVLSIDEAREKKLFIDKTIKMEQGDVESALAAAEHRVKGEFFTGGQEQFYLESQAAYVVPVEGRELVVHSSTQNTTEVQKVVAEVLGLKHSDVVCICKRMGGGFGGKETQAVMPALMAAIVAQKTRRPARCQFDKDTDMMVTGKRHPVKSFYEVGYNSEGRVSALKIDYFSDGGCTADLSTSIIARTLFHTDNCYNIPNLRATGTICRTNYPSNTAFRGFGGPQGVAAIENILEDIAARLKLDAYEVRRRNIYEGENCSTHYGQPLKNNVLPELFDQLYENSGYAERRKAIHLFNTSTARPPSPLGEGMGVRLKGLAFTGVKFGISFTTKFLNQGNALVNVYTDGTAQVSTGGTEMGQGLYTKVQQIVADELGIRFEDVRVMATSSEKSNNTAPTAASAGTDLNGNAAAVACRKIRERLVEFAAKLLDCPKADIEIKNGEVFSFAPHLPDGHLPPNLGGGREGGERRMTFAELTQKAWRERISMGERGFYATPGIDFDYTTGKGSPFYYFTNGACVAEVSIDRFTGALTIDRLDVLMDIGQPINPGIDRGQLIGGIVQGIGWATAEELKYNDKGALLSHSPTTYKIPNIQDIPDDFRLDFFENKLHDFNIRSSKAVAEPPLMLGMAVFCAVKNALSYLSPGETVGMNLPATHEEILTHIESLMDERNK
ncbi:MAG: xanthine dehydrogenase molybdopterin binding subunit [Turneriella sp.]|nr:xanthine dehydrogenase molybdopterin binding subunit [Turneriella sp.]